MEFSVLELRKGAASAYPKTAIMPWRQRLNEVVSECFMVRCFEDGNSKAIVPGKSLLSAEPKVAIACLRHGTNRTFREPVLNRQGCLDELGNRLLRLEDNAGEHGHCEENE